MAQKLAPRVAIYYLPELDTLDVWIDDPEREVLAEPLSDNVVLKLDRDGNVVGVEILTLRKLDSEDLEKLPENIRNILRETLRSFAEKALELSEFPASRQV